MATKKAPNPADLLDQASKPAGRSRSAGGYDYDQKDLEQAAGLWLATSRAIDQHEETLDEVRTQIVGRLWPWYRTKLEGPYEPSVKIDGGPLGAIRVTFANSYAKINGDKAERIRSIVGKRYDELFTKGVSLSVKKKISDDPQLLDQVVAELARALGTERFLEIFESETTVVPTEAFTRTRWQVLSDEKNAELNLLAVKQSVRIGEAK